MRLIARQARLAAFLLLIASMTALAASAEDIDSTIYVTFTAGPAGQQGTWDFSPTLVTLEPDQDTLTYELTGDSTKDWVFQHIAIGENIPGLTDFIDAPKMRFDDLEVDVKVSPRRIQVHFEGSTERNVELGVVLTVGNGSEKHTCRDPQIVLDRDPPPDPEG